jgi:hypothetical protein
MNEIGKKCNNTQLYVVGHELGYLCQPHNRLTRIEKRTPYYPYNFKRVFSSDAAVFFDQNVPCANSYARDL